MIFMLPVKKSYIYTSIPAWGACAGRPTIVVPLSDLEPQEHWEDFVQDLVNIVKEQFDKNLDIGDDINELLKNVDIYIRNEINWNIVPHVDEWVRLLKRLKKIFRQIVIGFTDRIDIEKLKDLIPHTSFTCFVTDWNYDNIDKFSQLGDSEIFIWRSSSEDMVGSIDELIKEVPYVVDKLWVELSLADDYKEVLKSSLDHGYRTYTTNKFM